MKNDESMGDGTEMYKLIQLRDQTDTISANKWTVNIAVPS